MYNDLIEITAQMKVMIDSCMTLSLAAIWKAVHIKWSMHSN